MSINTINQALQQALAKLDQSFSIKSDTEFAQQLNLGQVIKGKVLRHYEGSSYLVSFGSQEKVVDSAIPLKTGELIHGRVVGLGEQVKLQRVFSSVDNQFASQAGVADSGSNRSMLSGNEKLLLDLFDKYKAVLPEAERTAVITQMNKAGNASLMALSSLILSKLGLVQAPEFLRGIYKNLQGEQRFDLTEAIKIPQLEKTNEAVTAEGRSAVEQLAGMLLAGFQDGYAARAEGFEDTTGSWSRNNKFQPDPESQNFSNSGHDDQAYQEWLLGRWILNLQNEGAVSHTLGTFPLWFGDSLVEVNIAMFDQHRNTHPDQLRHKKIVFSIKTDMLGDIELTVVTAGRKLKIDVVADSEYSAVYLSGYIDELRQSLKQCGWIIEDISYLALDSMRGDNVVNAVVEHHITQNSLNQLM